MMFTSCILTDMYTVVCTTLPDTNAHTCTSGVTYRLACIGMYLQKLYYYEMSAITCARIILHSNFIYM